MDAQIPQALPKTFRLSLEKPRVLKQTRGQILGLMKQTAANLMPMLANEDPWVDEWALDGSTDRKGIQWLFRKLGWRWQHISGAILEKPYGVMGVTLSSPPSDPMEDDVWEAALVYIANQDNLEFRCPTLGVKACFMPGHSRVSSRSYPVDNQYAGMRLVLDDETLWLRVATVDWVVTLELGTCRQND